MNILKRKKMPETKTNSAKKAKHVQNFPMVSADSIDS